MKYSKPAPAVRTVLLEVTYLIEVPLVTVGRTEMPIEVNLQRDADALVTESVSCFDFGGYSMLGKAFSMRALDPWRAVRMKVVHKPLTTMRERLLKTKDAAENEWVS